MSLDLTFIAALLVSALLVTLLWARRRSTVSARGRAEEPLDTVQDWPPQAVRVMTLPERQTYEVIRRALPKHVVLAQVPLSRFISVPTKNSYAEWMRRAGRLSVDILVCDTSTRVIAAIDIRPAHQSPRSEQRHERLAQVLRAAAVPVHTWNAESVPTAAEVRALFKVGGASSEHQDAFSPGGKRILPVPEIMEMLADGDDEFTRTMVHDPVPSGFFDDLDALPSPSARH
jgi:hypothetical protein